MGINEVCLHLRILDKHDAKIIGTHNSHALAQPGGGLMGENKSPSPINLTYSGAFMRQSSIHVQLWSNNGWVFYRVKAGEGAFRNVVLSHKRRVGKHLNLKTF